MAKTKATGAAAMNFTSMEQVDVPRSRNGKHHEIVSKIMSDLEQLEAGRALKIPLSSLPDSKENVRSALNRAGRVHKIVVSTASDDGHLYVWKSCSNGSNGRK